MADVDHENKSRRPIFAEAAAIKAAKMRAVGSPQTLRILKKSSSRKRVPSDNYNFEHIRNKFETSTKKNKPKKKKPALPKRSRLTQKKLKLKSAEAKLVPLSQSAEEDAISNSLTTMSQRRRRATVAKFDNDIVELRAHLRRHSKISIETAVNGEGEKPMSCRSARASYIRRMRINRAILHDAILDSESTKNRSHGNNEPPPLPISDPPKLPGMNSNLKKNSMKNSNGINNSTQLTLKASDTNTNDSFAMPCKSSNFPPPLPPWQRNDKIPRKSFRAFSVKTLNNSDDSSLGLGFKNEEEEVDLEPEQKANLDLADEMIQELYDLEKERSEFILLTSHLASPNSKNLSESTESLIDEQTMSSKSINASNATKLDIDLRSDCNGKPNMLTSQNGHSSNSINSMSSMESFGSSSSSLRNSSHFSINDFRKSSDTSNVIVRDSTEVVLEGFLYKQSGWLKTWKKSWFHFTGRILYFWRSSARGTDAPQGAYTFDRLTDARAVTINGDDTNEFTFGFQCRGLNMQTKQVCTLKLATPSISERHAWLCAFQRCAEDDAEHEEAGTVSILREGQLSAKSRFLRRFYTKSIRLTIHGEFIVLANGGSQSIYLVTPNTRASRIDKRVQNKYAFRVSGLHAIGTDMSIEAPNIVFATADENNRQIWIDLLCQVGQREAETRGRSLINMLIREREDELESARQEFATCHFGCPLATVPSVVVPNYNSKIPCALVRLATLMRDITPDDETFQAQCKAYRSSACRGSGELGFRSEGVFRISSEDSELRICIEKIDKSRNSDDSCETFFSDDALLLAALTKAFLRQCPDALLAGVDQSLLAQADEAKQNEKKHVNLEPCICSGVISSIEEPQRSILMFVLDILVDVEKYKDCNLMTAKNIAVVIAPNLFPPPTETQLKNPIEAMKNMATGNSMVEALILWRIRTNGIVKT